MEGLPYDFGIEDDSSDDDETDKKSKKRSNLALEILTKDPEKVDEADTETLKKPTKESLLNIDESDPIDTAPELDAIYVAPLEHLSRVEGQAIAQTIASERLAEIRLDSDEDLTSETLAAESFLESVESTGDIEAAYQETLVELGEAAIGPTAYEYPVEIAEPVDPKTLVEAAKSELSPDVSYKIGPKAEAALPPPTGESKPKKTRQERRANQLHNGIVDYVIGRRFARIAETGNSQEVGTKLSQEVSQVHLEITARETRLRELSQSRQFNKKEKPAKSTEFETIGKVLVHAEMPDSETPTKVERAGISAHTFKRAELLEVASGIKIEGSSLKQIYEAHLVGEKGLRRIVAEYLRGGNFKRTLKRELLEREKDFERDPKLRDQASSQPVASSSSADLDNLLQKSGIDWSEPQPLMTKPKVKSNNLPALLNEWKSPSHPVRRVADIVMIGAIVAMAVIIGVLLFSR